MAANGFKTQASGHDEAIAAEVHQHYEGRELCHFSGQWLIFPNVGDRTLAVRLKAKTDGIDIVVDVIYIAKGNNGIALLVTGLQPLGGATLESLARKAVAHLDAAAR